MPQSEMPYVDIPSSKRVSLGLYSTAHASVEVGACMIADMRYVFTFAELGSF